MARARLLGPWRRGLQWTANLSYLLLPFARVGGRPALQFDIPALTLHFFGAEVRLGELYLAGLATLCLLFALLLAAVVLGRVWCGWACPQTALSDFAEAAARRLGLVLAASGLPAAGSRGLLLQLVFLAVGLLYGAAFVWYFLPPGPYLAALAAGGLGPWPLGTTVVAALLVYFDLAVLRRLLCREFCPYGRFQAALADEATLTLRMLPAEAARCTDCRACVRACPAGIDIRQEMRIECINCGRCLDACRAALGRRGETGIIGYAFGDTGRGWRALLSLRLAGVFFLFLLAAGALLVAAANRAPVSLKAERNAVAPMKGLADGSTAVFFTVYLENRSDAPLVLDLTAIRADGVGLALKGQTTALRLGAGERRRIAFAVVNRPSALASQVEFIASGPGGRAVAAARAYLPPTMTRNPM